MLQKWARLPWISYHITIIYNILILYLNHLEPAGTQNNLVKIQLQPPPFASWLSAEAYSSGRAFTFQDPAETTLQIQPYNSQIYMLYIYNIMLYDKILTYIILHYIILEYIRFYYIIFFIL